MLNVPSHIYLLFKKKKKRKYKKEKKWEDRLCLESASILIRLCLWKSLAGPGGRAGSVQVQFINGPVQKQVKKHVSHPDDIARPCHVWKHLHVSVGQEKPLFLALWCSILTCYFGITEEKNKVKDQMAVISFLCTWLMQNSFQQAHGLYIELAATVCRVK